VRRSVAFAAVEPGLQVKASLGRDRAALLGHHGILLVVGIAE
jgi:hypothetical protein